MERVRGQLLNPGVEHVAAHALSRERLTRPQVLEVLGARDERLDGDGLVGLELPVSNLVALLVRAGEPIGGECAGGPLVEILVELVA